ncbi:MAG: winged helix-turn-helix domain-containing protein, partial [Chitinivibrionales bacterium]
EKGDAGCIILDLMLPGMDGLEACRIIKNRQDARPAPVIMVTAKGDEADIVTGLELGADDYIVKPFSPRILIARLKNVLRRNRQETDLKHKPLSLCGIDLHPGRHECVIENRNIKLTSAEFKALYLLVRKPGWVFTRYQIVNHIHGDNYPVTDRSVDVMIAGLRKKMGVYGDKIETVRGIGYRFKDEESDYE